MTTTKHSGSLLAPCLATIVAAIGLGALAGKMAVFLYMRFEGHQTVVPVGVSRAAPWAGAAGGLVAAVFWLALMIPFLRRRAGLRAGRVGALVGVVVGILATVILHTILARVAQVEFPGRAAEGLLFGIPAGAALGVICGWLGRTGLRRADTSDTSASPNSGSSTSS